MIPRHQGEAQNQILHASYQGPLPIPAHLEHYNTIDSTFANRIMVMAETAQATSLSVLTKKVEAGAFAVTSGAWGQLFGVVGKVITDLVIVGVTVLFVYWDKNLPAFLAGMVAIILLLNTIRGIKGKS
jgi:uncharacterized membrane protein